MSLFFRSLALATTLISSIGFAAKAAEPWEKIPVAKRNNETLKEYVASGQTIRQFDSHFGWPGVTDEGLVTLKGHTSLLSLVWWTDGKVVGPTLRQILPTLTGLREITLEAGVVDDDIRLLASLPNLRSLTLGGADLSDAGLKHLAGMKSLLHLTLREGKVTDEGMKDVARIPNLQELSTPKTITDAGLRSLAAAPELQRLHVNGNQVTANGMQVFVGKKLRWLWVEPHLCVEPVLFVILPNMSGKAELDLMDWHCGDATLVELAQWKNLKSLKIRGEFSQKGMRCLAELKELNRLILARTATSAQAVLSLKGLPNLDYLALRGGPDETLALPALERLTGLELDGREMTDDGLKAIARLERLKSLSLDHAKFGEGGMAALAEAPRLTHLHLRESDLTDRGLLSLAKLKHLEWIDHSYSYVTPAGRIAFSRLRPVCELYEGE
jgi:hypothetical protein